MAILTKEQVQFIESYLIEQGVKYWDVRIEFIDHLVSKLEENGSIKLTRTLLITEFGTSISLDKIVEVKRRTLIRKYQNLVLKEIKGVFLSLKKTSIFLLMLVSFSLIYYKFIGDYLKWYIVVLWVIPLFTMLLLSVKFKMKKQKSIQVESAAYFMLWLFLSGQIILQIDHFDKMGWVKTFFFIYMVIYFLIFYGGAIVFNKTQRAFDRIFKDLKSE